MKIEYIENIPAQKIKHIIHICDALNCQEVMAVDNKISERGCFIASDDYDKMYEFCSEKCRDKWLNTQ